MSSFGKHLKDPVKNIKHFGTKQHSLELVSNNPNNFTDWGIIELIDLHPSMGQLTVSIDCDDWGWFGTAQIQLKMKAEGLDPNVITKEKQQEVVAPPVTTVQDPRASSPEYAKYFKLKKMGMPLEQLELKMKAEGKSIVDFSGREREVFSIFIKFNLANQHKMLPIPVCEIPKALL